MDDMLFITEFTDNKQLIDIGMLNELNALQWIMLSENNVLYVAYSVSSLRNIRC